MPSLEHFCLSIFLSVIRETTQDSDRIILDVGVAMDKIGLTQKLTTLREMLEHMRAEKF